MKRICMVLALTLIGVSACPYLAYADEDTKESIGLTVDIGADLVSSYLWRGQNLGGMSLQPSVTVGWKGLYACGWANLGADNWTFNELNPELDITIGYDNFGLQLDLTHLYYFDNAPYFGKGGFKAQEQVTNSTMEVHAGLHLGDLIDLVPLSVDWYTTIYGDDCYQDENGEWQRAWSTYIEVGYVFDLALGMTLDARVGVTPWRGMYSNYEEVWKNAKTIAINNINLRLERDFELKHLYFGVWGEMMLNCYGLDKTNLTTTLENKFDQRLNWRIGGSLYFGGEW